MPENIVNNDRTKYETKSIMYNNKLLRNFLLNKSFKEKTKAFKGFFDLKNRAGK